MDGSRSAPKNPTLAGVLSGLVPGLGQFYCRQWGKGAGFLIGALASTAVSACPPACSICSNPSGRPFPLR